MCIRDRAASIDGAGKMRQLWTITLPSILPTIVILLILRIGGLLNVGSVSYTHLQYSWTKGGLYEGIEARVDSPETAFVCEVVSTTQYPKGFSEFCKELAEKKIHYQAGQDAFIEYKGLNGKTMRLEYEGNVSKIDGEEIAYKSYPLYGSPYMQSKWGSGVTDLYYGGKALRIRQDGRMIDIGGKKDAEKE